MSYATCKSLYTLGLHRGRLFRSFDSKLLKLGSNAHQRTNTRRCLFCTGPATALQKSTNKKDRPLVVLVGWLGAQQRHLGK